MYIGRGASYISGVYVVGLLNVSHGVPLQICVWGGAGVYCAVATTRAAMTGKRPSVLLIVALLREGESFVVVVP
jgi:hypothetical protein